MHRIFSFLLFAAVLPAQAQLSLPDAQRRAVERSRQLAAQDSAVAASREMAVAAAQLPDPMLKFGIDNLPINGPDRFSVTRDFMTMRRIGVMQELTRGEKRESSCMTPIRRMVMKSRVTLKRSGPLIGRLSMPNFSIGSGNWAAATAISRDAATAESCAAS